jgi:hypothetical protein
MPPELRRSALVCWGALGLVIWALGESEREARERARAETARRIEAEAESRKSKRETDGALEKIKELGDRVDQLGSAREPG